MEDIVLEKISRKIAENYDDVKKYFYGKSDSEILEEAKRQRDYGNGSNAFIKNGTLYSKISFNKFRVTSVLNYIFNNRTFGNIVGIKKGDEINLYEKSFPNQLRKMMMGNRLHEIAEKYALTLNHFSVEENLSAVIDNDIVVGRLDLADKNTIIDIKTGKLHEDLAKMQLAIYSHIYSLKHGINGNINIAVVSPVAILKDVADKEFMDSYIRRFAEAKRGMKEELKDVKLYEF